MLEPDSDECDRLLVSNPFADHDSTVPSASHLPASSHHPLRSVSPACRCSTPGTPSVTMVSGDGQLRPRSMHLLSLDGLSTELASGEDLAAASGASQGGNGVVIHSVGPNDSFAGVALRYGVSIAAIRRANQLWPSDPIHLRTRLFIPRGDILPARHKRSRDKSAGTISRSSIEPTRNLSSDFISSSLVAARNMIFSLPARISLESLSSKASASEDHELDDLRITRALKVASTKPPSTEEEYELPILVTPRAQCKRPGFPLPSQASCPPSDHRHLDSNHLPLIGDLRQRSVSSPSVLLEQSRARPFAVLPVRTAQLEPEPAMELSVRRHRM